jgi:hypothetical protein
VTLCLPLGLIYLQQRAWDFKKLDAWLLAVAAPCLGLAAYAGYLQSRFGDPLAFVHAQKAAGWSTDAASLSRLTSDLRALGSFSGVLAGDFHVTDTANLFAILWAVPLAIGAWRMVGAPYAVWSFIIIASSLTIWVGFGRYVAPTFPLFITLATWLRRESWFLAVAFIWSILLTLFAILFAHFFWVA